MADERITLTLTAGSRAAQDEALFQLIHTAVSDPGRVLPRDREESVPHWAARAVQQVLREQGRWEEVERDRTHSALAMVRKDHIQWGVAVPGDDGQDPIVCDQHGVSGEKVARDLAVLLNRRASDGTVRTGDDAYRVVRRIATPWVVQ